MQTNKTRIKFLDSWRGLVMVLMALDHCRYFIGKSSHSELWTGTMVEYDGFWDFFFRIITHLCTPGFFFLMGVSLILLVRSRKKEGWNSKLVRRFLLSRGAILILIQFVIENPIWMLYNLYFDGISIRQHIGDLDFYISNFLYFGVLASLGFAMVFWALFINSRTRVIFAISCALILGYFFALYFQNPEKLDINIGMRILLLPGFTVPMQVFYPILPWIGISGLGMVLGRHMRRNLNISIKVMGMVGLLMVILFVFVRFNGWMDDFHKFKKWDWISFFTLTKYPPSLAFYLLFLGGNFILGYILAKNKSLFGILNKFLLAFGRSPLFFYLIHILLFGILGLFFHSGAHFIMQIALYFAVLFIMRPLCLAFEKRKATKSLESNWRMF
jgi:uncharacterized membrane protein